jgi:transposase-like protein
MKADTKARNLEIWRRMRNGETQMQIRNALVAAGYDVTYIAVRNAWQRMKTAGRPLGYSVDAERREEIARLAAEGRSIDAIAREVKVNPKTVKRWMGDELERRRAAAAAAKAARDELYARIIAMALGGKGARGIASELGVSVGMATRAIDRARQRRVLPPPRAMASYRKRKRSVAPAIPDKKRGPRVETITAAPVSLKAIGFSLVEADRLLGADSAAPLRGKHSPRRSGCDLAPALELDVTET